MCEEGKRRRAVTASGVMPDHEVTKVYRKPFSTSEITSQSAKESVYV